MRCSLGGLGVNHLSASEVISEVKCMQHSDLSKSSRVQAGAKCVNICGQTRQAETGAIWRTPQQPPDLQSGALATGPSPLATVHAGYNLGVICSLSRIALSCTNDVQRTLAVQIMIAASALADLRPSSC